MGIEPDFGMWEEGPEDHSSSFGAVLAGLTMWFDQGHFDYKYRTKTPISDYVPVSERLIRDGQIALKRLLPTESPTRPYDLAQLSLIWPYNIIDYDMKKTLLSNIETHLLGKRGLRRYPGDIYCGKGLVPLAGETAQWPLGLAWLSICYSKLAEYGQDYDAHGKPIPLGWDLRKTYFDKAVEYFRQLEANMTPEGWVPEMYVGDQMGHNTPLAWAQSFHIIAGQMLLNLAYANHEHFKLPPDLVRR